MKISIEGLIIKWAHQVVHTTSQRTFVELSGGRSALKRIPGRPLEWTQSRPDDWTELLERKVFFQRLNIGKLFNAQCRRINLESLFEQMSSPTSIKMASILNVLNSAYYPCFRLEPFIFLPQELLSGRCFDTWLLQWQKPKTYQFIFVLWNLISRLTLKIRCQFFNLSYLSGVGRCRIFWALSNLLPDAARYLPHLLHQRALQLPGKNHRSGAGKDRWQQQQICFSIWSLQEICNLLIDHACQYINPPTIFTIEVKYHRALPSLQTHGRWKRRSTKSRKRRKLSRSSNHASRCSHSLFGMNFPVERHTRRNAPPTSRRIQKNGISTKIWFSIDSTPFSIAWTLCWTAAIQQTNFSCSRRFGIFL